MRLQANAIRVGSIYWALTCDVFNAKNTERYALDKVLSMHLFCLSREIQFVVVVVVAQNQFRLRLRGLHIGAYIKRRRAGELDLSRLRKASFLNERRVSALDKKYE